MGIKKKWKRDKNNEKKTNKNKKKKKWDRGWKRNENEMKKKQKWDKREIKRR